MDTLWIDFVNSDRHDPLGREPDRDDLRDPAWLRRFLAAGKLPRIDVRSAQVQSVLGELRQLLLRLARSLVDKGTLRKADLHALNRYLAARPVTSRLEIAGDAFRLRLTSTRKGLEAVQFAIAESFAAFLAEGDPTRLKACQNPDCRWVFYDSTRSRTRRWCADSCGNLVKVREFRKRRKK